jgi:hypothetical protein
MLRALRRAGAWRRLRQVKRHGVQPGTSSQSTTGSTDHSRHGCDRPPGLADLAPTRPPAAPTTVVGASTTAGGFIPTIVLAINSVIRSALVDPASSVSAGQAVNQTGFAPWPSPRPPSPSG